MTHCSLMTLAYRRAFFAALFLSAAGLMLPSHCAMAQMMQPRPFSGLPRTTGPQTKPSATAPAAQLTAPTALTTAQPAQTPSRLQQPPTQAVIENTAGKLKIDADNASLTQTLQRIAEKTGMQMDGTTGDERVFGTFGPGDPRDVLSALLQGTSYNVIMVGQLESGLPRQLLLSQKVAAGTGIGLVQQPPPQASDDDNAEVPSEDTQPIPPPGRPIGGPGGQNQPHSPQELLQQLREQQQLQQQQNAPQ